MDNTDDYDSEVAVWCCYLCRSIRYHKPGSTEECRRVAAIIKDDLAREE